ncbi:uncharacterized protein G2W53_015359 [Senna tora]|uniref:Uncharacterized protein n=1 Tax=Senna tora TaxID=362788 RepID=A0A835C7Y4_9FABA|nr:uncharacterized protein G2W53_015359 [Senna tora]
MDWQKGPSLRFSVSCLNRPILLGVNPENHRWESPLSIDGNALHITSSETPAYIIEALKNSHVRLDPSSRHSVLTGQGFSALSFISP